MLSRKEKVKQNERRLKEIATELEGIAQTQAQSIDPSEQEGCLLQLRVLEGEQRALQNANIVLQKQLEEAERERIETNRRKWLGEERKVAEQECDEASKKVLTKIRNLKKQYDKLVETEQRWTERWRELGSPPFLNQNKPFASRAKRDIYQCLSMSLLPRRRQNDFQKEVTMLFGPLSHVMAIVSAEERRASRRAEELQEKEARKKELAAVEKLRSENESTEKAVSPTVDQS